MILSKFADVIYFEPETSYIEIWVPRSKIKGAASPQNGSIFEKIEFFFFYILRNITQKCLQGPQEVQSRISDDF